MRLSKLLIIIGVLLIIYAFVFGLQLQFVSERGNTSFSSSYSFKLGSFILGFILILLGRRLRKSEK